MSFGRQRWAIFISGTGSNLHALLDMRDHVDIALVVSSKAQAPGLLKARRAGIPTLVLDKKVNWMSVSENHRPSLHQELVRHRVDKIFLLGFMKLLPQDFVNTWKGKMLNVHPSLLPLYPGLKSIEKAYEKKDVIGVTVHEVIAEMDAGTPISQRLVLKKEETLSSIEQTENLVHLSEHRLVRESVRKWKTAPT
ncbi:MAG: formyltransferase family protein [Bdellovibrionales bacterium]